MAAHPQQLDPSSMPQAVRGPVWVTGPATSAQNVRNVGTVKHPSKAVNSKLSDTGRAAFGSIGETS